MPDYGHDLLLGSFLTPSSADAAHVVDLARLSERVGLDLVTFQDHPYQPRHLDAWTLLTWVAAVTERVHVAANVTNLPLRPPAVLAQAAASLDLLSGGRFELGLGAGAFWDAIEAMGGRRLEPGQAVDGLSEAIDIMRGSWETAARERFVVDGAVHRVEGAKRGPAPAHDIAIWVGAYRPRMLRLVGRKADGWLPSVGYQTVEQIVAGNAVIDEAAAAAGRDPRAVRRLLNVDGRFSATASDRLLDGPPEQWVDQLAALTLEHGFSGYVLGADDPEVLTRFGDEVGPALRDLVAAERGGQTQG